MRFIFINNEFSILRVTEQQLNHPLSEQSSTPTTIVVDNTMPQDTNGNVTSKPADDVERRTLLEKLDHLERKNAKLEFDSAQVHAVDRKKTELIEMLQRESDVYREDVKVVRGWGFDV